ncbi:MAG: hypothetical protein ACOX0W_01980 [Sphaerochaetaceae bacterium]
METIKKKKPRVLRAIAITLLTLLILIWAIGIPIANSKVASLVKENLPSHITVSSIEMNITRGSAVIHNLEIVEQDQTIRAETVYLNINVGEVLKYVAKLSDGIESLSAYVENLNFKEDVFQIDVSSVAIEVKGDFSLENLILQGLHSSFVDIGVKTSIGINSKIKEFNLFVQGPIDIQKMDSVLDKIPLFRAEIHRIKPEATGMTNDLMNLLIMFSPTLFDLNNWETDLLTIEGSKSSPLVDISHFSIDSKILKGIGSSQLKDKDITLHLEVEKVDPLIREELSLFLFFMGHSIPQEPFTFEFNWNGEGMPYLNFAK